MARVLRKLLAVADCFESARRDTKIHQIVVDSVRAALPERQIVLYRATLVTMPFDEHRQRVVLREDIGMRVERHAGLVEERGAVEIEEDVRKGRKLVDSVERHVADPERIALVDHQQVVPGVDHGWWRVGHLGRPLGLRCGVFCGLGRWQGRRCRRAIRFATAGGYQHGEEEHRPKVPRNV